METVYTKLVKSTRFNNYDNCITPEEIQIYFNIFNKERLISQKKYSLELISNSNYDKSSSIITFDNTTNTYIINMHKLKIISFSHNIDNPNSVYNFNLELLETIHKVFTDINLRDKLDDEITYKLDPIFYTSLVREFYGKNNNNYLRINYLNIGKMLYTTNFLNLAVFDYNLDVEKVLEYIMVSNKKVNNQINKHALDTSIIESSTFCKMDDLGYYLDTEAFSPDINERTLEKFEYAYNMPYKMHNKNLLYAILTGRKLTKKQKKLLEEIQKNNDSILEYCNNLSHKNKLIISK